jgi:hypothetical protein
MVKALALLSNGISASMLEAALEHDGYHFADVAVIAARRLQHSWKSRCDNFVEFNKAPSLKISGQINTLDFYREAVKVMKMALRSQRLTDIYIANADNLISNHMLRWAERHPNVRVSVVAEGFMNYQEIGLTNRARWRWRIKPIMAAAMGLRYRQPKTHLSGSFEPRINRVISFSAYGLKAPTDRILILPLPITGDRCPPNPDKVLVVLTGIGQWMAPQDFATFKQSLGHWIRSLGAKVIVVKRHPNYPSGGIEDQFGDFTYLEDQRGLEMMAGDIDAGRVIGFCSTALVTLKLLRPELTVIDFGSDFYCEKAYHGDRSIIDVLSNGGVDIVNFEPTPFRSE